MEEKNKKFTIRCRGIIIHEGKLLVVRHPDNNFITLPGGHLEFGEDIKEGLRRELVEELGISPEIGRLLYINNFTNAEDIQSIEFLFEILNSGDFKKNIEDIVRTHAHEIAQISWAGPTDDETIFLPKGVWEDFKAGKIFSDQVRYVK